MKKYKVGIVGFGGAGMALYNHFTAHIECKVLCVFDVADNAFKRAKEVNNKLLLFKDYNEFLNSGIDIVVVSSPDSTHADYLYSAVQKGLHVLCEKPLTDSFDGINKILKVSSENPNVVIGVQHQMRCLPLHRKIKKIVDSGELGKIGYIEGYYVHNLTERAFVNDLWRLSENATPLIYSGIHFVDALRWIVGEEIIEVCAMANNICFPEYPESDLNVILLKFESGIIGKVVTAFGAARPQDHSIQIYGSEKSITNNLLFSKDGEFEIISEPIFNSMSGRKNGFIKDIVIKTFSKAFKFLIKIYPYNSQYNVSNYPIRLYEHSLSVKKSVDNFISSINGTEKIECTIVDAAKSVAVALAGVESYRSGKFIKVIDIIKNEE